MIALSACLGGEIPRLILNNRVDEAKQAALGYREMFGEDFYLEVMRHPIPELGRVNEGLLDIQPRDGHSDSRD